MEVNCGYGRSKCDLATVRAVSVELANSGRPKKGLFTAALRLLMTFASRSGDVLRYAAGMGSNCCDAGRRVARLPRYITDSAILPGSSRSRARLKCCTYGFGR